ncbi:MAG: tetratricopeptide repeat protein [Balneolales bacterium]
MKQLLIAILAFIITSSDAGDRAREANRAYESGDYSQAEMIYREILETQPENQRILFNLGNTLARQGKTEESLEVFYRYRELASDLMEQAPAEYNLGHLYGESGNLEEALRHLRRSLDLNPDDEDAKFNYELLKRRQMQSSPEDDEEEQEEQEQPPSPDGQPPPINNNQQDTDSDSSPEQEQPAEPQQPEDNTAGGQPDVTEEQIDHAEDIMNALEQIEKDLIKDFKKRQLDPVDPNEKDW